jgi:methyl-accepting chemotaxis protein
MKLIGNTDVEDSLQRLDDLTNEEAWMASAELRRSAHNIGEGVQGAIRGMEGVNNKMQDVHGEVERVGEGVQEVCAAVQGVDHKVQNIDVNVQGVSNKVDQVNRQYLSTSLSLLFNLINSHSEPPPR